MHLCGNQYTTCMEYKMESVLKLQKKNLGSQNILGKEQIQNNFSATLKRKQLTAMEHSISPRKRRARCIPANASMCFLILHTWSMNVPSTDLYKENTPFSQVIKCKWCVHIYMVYIKIQNYKFCSTLNEKCIIEEILLNGS